jgi:hypothetical protein
MKLHVKIPRPRFIFFDCKKRSRTKDEEEDEEDKNYGLNLPIYILCCALKQLDRRKYDKPKNTHGIL